MLACSGAGQDRLRPIAQFHPVGHGFEGYRLGVVVAIFSLVGFECATAFGEEAKKPLTTIPRAVIASLLLTGVLHLHHVCRNPCAGDNNPTLDQLSAPLTTLSENLGMKWMGVLISLGAMVSFFALALSCLNAGARVLFTMGRYGIFPISVGSSHMNTISRPHIAISLFAAIQFCIPTVFMICCLTPGGQAADRRPSTRSTTPDYLVRWDFAGLRADLAGGADLSEKDRRVEGAPHRSSRDCAGTFRPFRLSAQFTRCRHSVELFPYIFAVYLLIGVVLVSMRSRSHVEMDGIRKVLEETAMAPMPAPSIAMSSVGQATLDATKGAA